MVLKKFKLNPFLSLFVTMLFLAIAFLTACTAPENDYDSTVYDIPENSSVIYISNQTIKIKDNSNPFAKITVDFVHFDSSVKHGGYVVIQPVDINIPQERVGFSELIKPNKKRVYIDIEVPEYLIPSENSKIIKKFVAFLHFDNGDRVFQLPGPDGPVLQNGKPVYKTFTVEIELS